ncbi:MAG: DUF1259 domain-containing protein [Vicinamibacterales bacterium]
MTATVSPAQELPAEYKVVLDAHMNVHGHGGPAEPAKRIKPALDLIGKVGGTPEATTTVTSTVAGGAMDTAMGATINARMGRNTWAAFFDTDANAVVAGDVAMLDTEVTPVWKALRANGIEVVAIHHHITATQPTIIFLHYWGQGPARKLAAGMRAAVDQTGPRETR